jgi:outer membrane immunogenic protein
MKKVLYASVGVVALLRAGTSTAADMPRRVPVEPAPVAFSWNGFYVGGHTGVAVGRTTTSNNAPYGGFDAGVPLSFDLNPVMIFGGGQLGYNWQYGAYVFGLESDIGYLGLRETIRPAPDDFVSLHYGWYATMTGRLGFASNSVLTYVKGGAAVASITNQAGNMVGGVIDPDGFADTKKTRWGWTVGAGFEYAVARNWSVKTEYLFMDFGKHTTANLDGDTFTNRNQVHTWKVGVNYRFGGYDVPLSARY